MANMKKMSRRDFLKLAGSAAVAATAGGILEACSPTTTPAAPAATATTGEAAVTTAPTAASAGGGKTLVLAIQSFAHDALKPVLAEWESKTGNKVTLESGPATGQEMMTKYAPAFQSNTSPVDVLSVDDVSGPAFARAGWLEPLDSVIPADTWSDFPESFLPPVDKDPFHSFDGKRYRVPHEFAVGYFWYRKDWFDDKKVKVPTTWDEFVSLGKEFTQGEVWGTTEGMKKPGLTFVYVAHLAAAAGGNVFDFDEGTGKALQFIYDMIYTNKIMSDSVLTQDYTQQNDLYMKDRVAMMRQWPYFWGVAHDNKAWFKEGMTEIALHPKGPSSNKTWYGGWGFSLVKFSKNMDAAKDLIAFVTNNQNAPTLAKGQSWFVMPRKSILAAMKGESLVPAMQMYTDANALVPRPYHPKQSDAETAVDDISQLFLTKQVSLSDALKQGKDRIAALGS
ncbi:MAG: extracellular solute-binding protein [Omnitrophica WOR_2 bacterium]